MINKILITLLAIMPGVALADPATAAIIGTFLKKVIVSAIVSAIVGSVFAKKASKRGAQQAQGVMVNKQSNNEPIPVVYGHMRMGGTRVFVETSDGQGGAGSNTLNMALVMSEGQMGNLTRLWFNDQIVFEGTAIHNSIHTDNVSGNKYSGTVSFQYMDGRDDQTTSSLLKNSVGASKWGDNHRLQGLAYIAIKMTANAEKYSGGVPLITAEVNGKLIKNISDDSLYAQADQNPVDVLYDYLTNPRYGKGMDASEINLPSFQQARLDVSNKFPVNGVLFSDSELYENVNSITGIMNGLLIYTAGTYKLKIQKADEAITRTLDEHEIVGSINIAGNQKGVRLNKVTIEYTNSAIDYNEDVLIHQDATYLAEDSGVTFETTAQIDLMTDATVIQQIANYILADSRVAISLEFEAAHTLLTAECGDIIGITHPALGYDNKPFRIQQLEITPENTVKISCKLYISDIQL